MPLPSRAAAQPRCTPPGGAAAGAGAAVPPGELVDARWEHVPASAVNTVHKHARAPRAVLEPGRGGQLLTGDYSYAEDLVQASLIKLRQAWPRLDTSTDRDAYLRRIIAATRVSSWRREIPVDVLPEEAVSGDDPAERHVPGVLVRQSWPGCPGGSARSWCCGTARTCPKPKSPPCPAAHPGRSRATRTAGCARCGSCRAANSRYPRSARQLLHQVTHGN